jgi:hypothetical protein
MSSVTVQAKALGRKKPLFPDWTLSTPPEWDDVETAVSLRDLVTRIVYQEVSAFRQRQAERRFIQILTQQEIARGAQEGKVSMGGTNLDQHVDTEAAVATALQAFEDGVYLVFVDGPQVSSLDEQVHLKPGSQVTFVRLVALAGG